MSYGQENKNSVFPCLCVSYHLSLHIYLRPHVYSLSSVCDKHPPKEKSVKQDSRLLRFCNIVAKKTQPIPLLLRPKSSELDKKIFIEALSCNGGCLAGPCSSTKKPELLRVSDVLSKVNYRDEIPKTPDTVVEKDYEKKDLNKPVYSYENITEALKKVGKYTEEDELNCGGCGYNTCRELACALISGEAEPSMCVSYMRKIAMQKAAAMLRCMPSASVMVDKDLRIVETNEAFMKMFCSDMLDIFPEGINGASIDRIVDFADIFKETLKTQKDIHKEHYPLNNRIYDISAFSIEKNELAGAIITDVTQSEMGREKIAQRAHEVINKNIAIVQEIACLLGEHMVETELLLSTIAQDYDTNDSGDKK